MNRKLFKKLLFTASLMAPISLITPMILTSCNDNKNNSQGSNGDNTNNDQGSGGDDTNNDQDSSNKPPTDGNGITLVTFNSLLKEAKSFINPKNNVFWMNIDDSGPFYYNEDGNPTEFGKFYEEILKNTSLNFLTSKEYKVIDYSTEGLEEDKDVSIYKKTITNKDDKLLTLLKGLILSNFQIKNINQDISEEEKKNDQLGIEILGSKIDLGSLIGENKVDVNSYIKLVNKDFPDTKPIDANSLHKSYNYEFVYSIKPKGNYYWNGIDSKSGKNKQALEIRISDYINDILFIDNLNNFKLENQTVNFTGEATGLTLGTDTGSDITTTDLFVTEIKKNLGELDESNTSLPFYPVKPTANTDLRKVFEIFIKTTSSSDFSTKIIGKKPDDTNLNLKTSDISIDSLSEAFKKNRVEVNAKVEIDSTKKIVTTKMNIKLNNEINNLGYFSWLLKDKSINSYTNAVIEFTLKWTFN